MRFEPEHEIEVAKSNIGVDENDTLSAFCERRAEVRGGRRFPNATLTRRNDDATSCHLSDYLRSF